MGKDTGEIIRILRTKKGITMQELGNKVGVTPQAISQYERGIREPNDNIFKKICDTLDFDLEPYIKKVIEPYPIWKKSIEYLVELMEYAQEKNKIDHEKLKYITIKEIDLFIKDSIAFLEVIQKKHEHENSPDSEIILKFEEKEELTIELNDNVSD